MRRCSGPCGTPALNDEVDGVALLHGWDGIVVVRARVVLREDARALVFDTQRLFNQLGSRDARDLQVLAELA